MDKKKIFIIVFVILTFSLLFFIFYKNKRSSDQSIKSTQIDTANFINESASSKESPVVKNSITVINPTDPNEVKSAFNKFASSQPKHDIEWTNIKNTEGKSISLDEFSNATSLKISQAVHGILSTNGFDLFSCPLVDGEKNIGIIFTLKLLPDYKGNLYKDELAFMKNWEPTLFQDTKSILFPGKSFSADDSKQTVIFKDGKYRYADIYFPNNSKVSINYAILEDFIIVSDSDKCIDYVNAQLFDTSN